MKAPRSAAEMIADWHVTEACVVLGLVAVQCLLKAPEIRAGLAANSISQSLNLASDRELVIVKAEQSAEAKADAIETARRTKVCRDVILLVGDAQTDARPTKGTSMPNNPGLKAASAEVLCMRNSSDEIVATGIVSGDTLAIEKIIPVPKKETAKKEKE